MRLWWWLLPLWRTLHYFSIALLVGVAALVDLRILGVARGLAIRPLQRLMPWAVGGFAVSIVTGIALFRINPATYVGPPINVAFAAKMLFIVMIGLNDLLYFASGLKRHADDVGAGEDAAASAKIVAGVSLLLWAGVIYWSRMLTFLAGAI